MSFPRTSFLIILAFFAVTSGYFFIHGQSPVSKAFCRGLSNEAEYEKIKQEHLKYLVSGRHDWIFRSKNDFRSDIRLDEKTKSYLLSLQDALKQKNIDLVIIYPPIRGLVHAKEVHWWDHKKYGLNKPNEIWDNYEGAIAEWQKSGLNVVGVNRSEVAPDFYYKRNHHWTAHGARISAKKTANYIKKLPAYQEIPKSYFVTVEGPAQAYETSFRQAFKKICGTKLPPETTQQFITSPSNVGTKVTEQDLFNEENSQAKIMLLGTSNSVEESSLANFEGFLKEELGTDIDNMAFIGSGIDTSIISFLNSPTFENGQVRIIIWEVPSYYDFSLMDDKLFQQAIPAAYGPCPEEGLAMNFPAGSLHEGDNAILDFSHTEAVSETADSVSSPFEQIRQAGKEYYLHLSFSEPVKDPFAIKFFYTGGGTKRQELERAESYPHDNKFYTLFPPDVDNSKLKKIAFDLPPSAKTMSLFTQICPRPEHTNLLKVVTPAKIENTETGNNPQP